MESDKGLAPQVNALDSAAFQRVWSRVTAGQEHSPIAASSTAAPPASPPEDALALWIDRLARGVGDDLALARRWPGAAARAACANVGRLRPLLRRLDTAYFLLTGRRHRPASGPALPVFPRDQALRLRWLRLREWSEQLPQSGLPPELSQELAVQLAAAGEELYALLQRLSPI